MKISDEQKRCNTCGCQAEADTESCPECGGTDLVRVRGPALAHLMALHQYLRAQRTLMEEEPMVRCAFCGTRSAAVKAFHSRYDGRAVCLAVQTGRRGERLTPDPHAGAFQASRRSSRAPGSSS